MFFEYMKGEIDHLHLRADISLWIFWVIICSYSETYRIYGTGIVPKINFHRAQPH